MTNLFSVLVKVLFTKQILFALQHYLMDIGIKNFGIVELNVWLCRCYYPEQWFVILFVLFLAPAELSYNV